MVAAPAAYSDTALLFDDGSVTPEGDITETTAETEIWLHSLLVDESSRVH